MLYIIDSGVEDVVILPNLETTSPQILEISKSPGGKVYEQTSIDINLKLGSTIPPLGLFTFTFPQRFLFTIDNERPTCVLLSDPSDTDGTKVDCNAKSFSQDPALLGIKELTFTNMCFKDGNFERSICRKGSSYLLRVTNVVNP